MDDNLDILSPEFFELAAKAKTLSDQKTKESQLFREIFLKHKQKLAEIDQQVVELKDVYFKAMKAKKDDASEVK